MIIVLLSACNEEKSFPPLMKKLQYFLEKTGQDFKFLICNDGSSDRTSEILTEYSERLPTSVVVYR